MRTRQLLTQHWLANAATQSALRNEFRQTGHSRLSLSTEPKPQIR
jgi:hypothetical protein